MKKKTLLLCIAVILLSSCSRIPTNPISGKAEIDWVDFVKLDGDSYTGSWDHVMKNPGQVTDKVVGEVKFKVADVVTNPGYRTKDGDAAFLQIGTKLYLVDGYKKNEIVAAKDDQQIGGYRIYMEDNYAQKMRRHYQEIPRDKVEKVELYHGQEVTPYKTLMDADKKRFIELLDNGQDTQNYTPQNNGGDPEYYKMVFYTDQPIAYAFTIADDGTHVFFSPWDTRLVDREIRTLMLVDNTDKPR